MIRPVVPSLLDRYDALLVDLDGTLIHGARPIPHAAEGLRAARRAGLGIGFATNNASRSAQQTAEHLGEAGIDASADEVISSPQVAAALLAQQLDPAATVLVVGSDALAAQIREVGLTPVDRDREDVVAVVQGFAPDLAWPLLAEGAYALRRGAAWMATNVDATLPTERGLAPGNGSLVAALAHATGRRPEVAGKPAPGMFQEAARRLGADRPLVVGDRLDTDIEGASAAGLDSLFVLTGVNTVEDALRAIPAQRPTWVRADLSTLGAAAPEPVITADGSSARCARSSARWVDGDLELRGADNDPDAAQCALALLRRHLPEDAFTGQLRRSGAEAGA
ncbi:HAD-IIA family hydrolase [Brachybacterium sp. EF45031]|uniref:HAD-IIA family hydrolase n=1 Tax=Brachybacterium sillae TaxID=2810536 RepID=UPI00217DC242|nr:HAD-IIA family hydrolase [Brachybacterium sillae]MCS6712675.1 HAD-IIA family hydrolase [Brachybacterium sillae]